MLVYLVARAIQTTDTFRLIALNAIQYGPGHVYDPGPLTPEIGEELFPEFEILYPDKCLWFITLERIL